MSYANDMPFSTETRLSAALRMSVTRLARRLRAERAETHLTLSQLSALASIDRHGPLTLGELAAREKVQPPSMTRIVGILAERRLVVREPNAADGRQVVLSMSAAGVDLLYEDRRRREAWLAQQLRQLTPDELSVLKEAAPILDKLASA
jgi:DNA-binding MarR family transcriptional regulator